MVTHANEAHNNGQMVNYPSAFDNSQYNMSQSATGEIVIDKIDFSEALVLDEQGRDIKALFISQLKSQKIIWGGSWSSGSGYKGVIGANVSTTSGSRTIQFKADFELIQGGKSQINRIYKVILTSNGGHKLVWQGVGRKQQTATYSAYGGAKADMKNKPASNWKTEYCYLRVKDGSYWTDSSL